MDKIAQLETELARERELREDRERRLELCAQANVMYLPWTKRFEFIQQANDKISDACNLNIAIASQEK